MITLSDLLVVIPVRHDGPARRRNLAAVIRCFKRFFRDSQLLLVEQDGRPRMPRFALMPGVEHAWIADRGPFHRTRMLNLGFSRLPERPFVAAWDADAVPHPEPLALAMERLRAGAGVVLPYDGRFIDVRGEARRVMIQGIRAGRLTLPDPDGSTAGPRRGSAARGLRCINQAAVGGAVLFNRQRLLERGGYNEHFVSWGWEDTELALRLTRLGCAPVRVAGYPLFHLAHPRGRDSSKLNPHFPGNRREYRRIRAMSVQELHDQVTTGGLASAPGTLLPAAPAGARGLFLRLVALLSR